LKVKTGNAGGKVWVVVTVNRDGYVMTKIIRTCCNPERQR